MVSTSYIDRYNRADGSQYRFADRGIYVPIKRCDGQSAYVAHRIDGAVIEH